MEAFIELAGVVLKAVLDKEWWLLASAVVTGLMLTLRLGPIPLLKTIPFQVLGSFLLATLGGVLNVLAAGEGFSPEVLVAALKIGAAAGAAVGGIPALLEWWKGRKEPWLQG